MIMKKAFKISVFCLAPLFIFSLYVFSAVDARLLAAKPPVLKIPVKSGENSPAAQFPASAAEAKNGAVPGQAAPEAKVPAVKADPKDYTEFDDFNNVSDPLYREGSRVLLKQAADEDLVSGTAVKKTSPKPELMRDAPADIPARSVKPLPAKAGDGNKPVILPVKKDRLMKLVPADPVKNKSTL